jgi:geranylgeranyl diphosphate synthase, type I
MIDPSLIDPLWSNPQIDQAYADALRKACQLNQPIDEAGRKLSALPILFCEANGGSRQQVLPIVSVWHLLRHAARILDDIEDGNAITETMPLDLNVSTGLIFTASYLLSQLEASGVPAESAQAIRDDFHVVLLQTCGGQHQDLTPSQPSLEKSWQIAEAKSGASLGLICWASGYVACSDHQELNLYRQFGHKLGLLDQIHDDLVDLSSKEDLFAASKHSLPVGYAATVLPKAQKETLLSLLDTVASESNNAEQARQLITNSGAAVYLVTKMSIIRQEANQLLQTMKLAPDIKNQLQTVLEQIAPQSVKTAG